MKKHKKRELLIGTALITALLIPAIAFAQDTPAPDTTASASSETGQIPEIVVTSQRRKENLQKSAASISVRSGEDLVKQGRITLQQFLEDVPGVVDTQQNNVPTPNPGSSIVIRGLVTDQVGGGITPPGTAVYTDGVYEGLGGNYDVDRIEVLRGPQGTLYGRSATGGVVSINTVQPNLHRLGGDLTVEGGNYNLKHVQGAINLPLGDKLALRIAGNVLDQDGFYSAKGGFHHSESARAKLLYRPSDTLEITLAYAYQNERMKNGGVGYDVLTGSGTDTFVASDVIITPSSSNSHQMNASVNWNLGNAVLSYTGAYRTYSSSQLQINGPGAGVVQSLVTQPYQNFTTHEIHLSSPAGSKVTWIGGIVYYDNAFEQDNVTRAISSGGLMFSFPLKKDTTDLGAFTQITFPLSDTLRLTTGLRYDNTQVQVEEAYSVNTNVAGPPVTPDYGLPEVIETLTLAGTDGLKKYNNLTYKLRLEKDLSPTSLLYLSLGNSFQPGDVRVNTVVVGNLTQPIATVYEQESLTALEIGTKNRFLENRLQLNAAAYYNDYSGYNIGTNVNAGSSNPAPNYVLLQSPVKMTGIEVDASFMVTPKDRLNVASGYTKAEFVDSLTDGPYPFRDYFTKKEVPNVVPFTLSASYTHSFDFSNGSKLDAQISANHFSSYDGAALSINTLDAADLVRVGDQTIGNLYLTWTSPNGLYALSGYVRNFTDTSYKTTMTVSSGSDVSVYPSDPLTAGLILRLSY